MRWKVWKTNCSFPKEIAHRYDFSVGIRLEIHYRCLLLEFQFVPPNCCSSVILLCFNSWLIHNGRISGLVFCPQRVFFWSWIPCWSCTGTRYVCLAKANDGCCSYNSSWRSWHGAIGAFKECNVWTWHQLSFAVFIYTVICEFVLNYLVPVVWDSLYEHWTMYALWSAVFSLHHDVCRAGRTDLPIFQNVAFSFYIQPVRWQW